MTDFTQLGLSPETLKAVVETGYTIPTPIQEQAIPVALAGRDVLGIAQTGTGKTAAFTLPMIDRLAAGRAKARMPRSLVVAPTRELADQVAASFDKYAKGQKLTWALLIGGVSFGDQERKLDRGVDVLIATPGRLLDHHERGKLLLTGVQIMVVDEADRMLDMGFIPDLERIFKLTPASRQTLFFSATMPPEITRLTTQFLKDPTRIEASRPATTADTISQYVAMIPSNDAKAKRGALRALIGAAEVQNGIVFCNRKTDVDIVAKSLAKHGFDAAPIHGDLDQSVRTRTLEGFRRGELKILVASDVAARGLDIPAVSHIFNYDVPFHADDYVHRIGRTGRAGRLGEAFMIVTPGDLKNYDKVVKLTKKEPETVVLDLDWDALTSGDERGGRAPRGAGDRSRSRNERPRSAARRSPAADLPDAEAQPEPEPQMRRSRSGRPQANEAQAKATPASETRASATRASEAQVFSAEDVELTMKAPSASSTRPPREIERHKSPGAAPSRDTRTDPRASRSSSPRGSTSELHDASETAVVGFGSDAPAFLLRAAPLPPIRKTAAAET